MTTQQRPSSFCHHKSAPSALQTRRQTACRVAAPRRPGPEKATPSEAPGGATVPDSRTTTDVGKSVPQAELRRYLDAYKSQPIERAYEVPASDIEGTIPTDLKGTLLRNGPGNFDIGDSKITHMFDGDGFLGAFAFDGGRVTARRKFVRTKALVEEMRAGKIMSKSVFTVGSPDGQWASPFDFSVRCTANTGIVDWAGRILALYEADLPYEVDATLRTLGRTDLNRLQDEDPVAAHYRIIAEDDGSKRLLLLAPVRRTFDVTMKMLEFDESGRIVAESGYDIEKGAFGFFHDFLATENYYVFLQNPMDIDLWKLLTRYTTGQACLAECLFMVPGVGQTVHIVPRPGKRGGAARTHAADIKFTFHHVNAFEADNDTVVIDTLGRNKLDFGTDMTNASVAMYKDPNDATTLRRLVCRAGAARAEDHDFAAAPVLDRIVEFAALLPAERTGREYSTFFCVSNRDVPQGETGVVQCLGKVRVDPTNGVSTRFDASAATFEQYYPGDKRYCEEPVFVPREGATAEDDGYVLSIIHDMRDPVATTCKLAIFDGRDIAAGPVVTIRLEDAAAPGLHGSWTERVLGAQPGEALPDVNNIRVSL